MCVFACLFARKRVCAFVHVCMHACLLVRVFVGNYECELFPIKLLKVMKSFFLMFIRNMMEIDLLT